MRNFNTLTLSTIVAEICGPNPYRCALVFSPVGGQNASTPALVATAFAAGANQTWRVPAGVTSVIDMYAWGSGGNSGAAGAVLGGGGGGGGAFATTGPLTVVPSQVYSINVDAGGGASVTTIANPSGTVIANAGSGPSGLLDARGVGGAPTVGVVQQSGGRGFAATTLAGSGGGGGGGAGNVADGSSSGSRIGGAGGGAATLSTYGAGGAGGNGGLTTAVGLTGASPGGGAGGPGNNGGAAIVGADGLAVVFYTPSSIVQGISLDQDPSLILAQGAFNYLAGATYPTVVSRRDIGDCIIEPWYAIAGISGQVLRVTEYSYVPEASGRDVQGAGKAFTLPPYAG